MVESPRGPEKLEQVVVKRWQIGALVGWGIFALLVGGFLLALSLIGGDLPLWVPGAVVFLCVLAALLSYRFAWRTYQAWTFEVTPASLILRHGVYWRIERHVARARIQHLDISSGPFDRRFGVVEVSVFVAGTLGAVGQIPGLSPERAEALRADLLAHREANA